LRIRGIGCGALLAAAALAPLQAAEPAAAAAESRRAGKAHFGKEAASRDAVHIANWVLDSADHGGLPFAIVDKKAAKVFVFDAEGRLRGATPALLGAAHGDHAVPGIGERPMSSIRPEERTTSAGRFVARIGHNQKGVDVLWVDYETAISMHRVVTAKPAERRLQRLATATPADNRISYGCINVPVKFYENVVSPTFTGTAGIVYVLPETRPAREVFASYDVNEHASLKSGNGPRAGQ
jgi:hypothetical protein